MAIGTSRRTTYGLEKDGWSGFFTTVKTAAISGATSLDVIGNGGPSFGVPTVAVGMKVFFLDDLAEAPKAVTAVSVAGSDATLTIAGLTNAKAAGDKVFIGYAPTKALLLDAFSSKRNLNKWSTSPYSGSRAKNVSRSRGRVAADGSISYMLRPSVNMALLVKAIGQDGNVTGTVPGTPVNTTSSGATAIGDKTITVTSATSLATNDIIQIGSGTSAECRKITNISTNTLTLDAAMNYVHASGAAVAKVVAPFLHTIPSAANFLDSIVIEDYIPFDDDSVATKVATTSYLLPGAIMKSFKVESQSDQGISVTLDYMCHDKVVIPVSAVLPVPSEETFTFDEEAVLFDGVRNYRCEEISIEGDNDLQVRYTKNGDTRAFAVKAGQQEVKGSFKFYEDAATQIDFWKKVDDDTTMALDWKITDRATQYFVQFLCPQIVLDEFNDGEFSPADLIDCDVPWVAILDAGASNVQLTLRISNADYLPY